MIKHAVSLFVPAAAVALSIASASHASTPLRGAVRDFTSRLDSPGPYVMEVSSDNSIKMPSFQALIRFQRGGPSHPSLQGDTGNVRFRATWDPDQAQKTAQLFTTAASIQVDASRRGIDNDVNGFAFDGKAISTLGWGLRDAVNAYPFWCSGPKRYTIPGNVQVTVDGLFGPGTNNPSPTAITLEVRCVTPVAGAIVPGVIPGVIPGPGPGATGKPPTPPPPPPSPPKR